MPGVGRHGNERENFGIVIAIGRRATIQPVFDGRATVLINSVWRIHKNGPVVPRFFKAVVNRQAIHNFRVNDGMLIRAGIEFNHATEELF